MGDEDHGDRSWRCKRVRSTRISTQPGVQVGKRLVEKKDPGLADNGPAQGHALPLASRNLGRLAVQDASRAQRPGLPAPPTRMSPSRPRPAPAYQRPCSRRSSCGGRAHSSGRPLPGCAPGAAEASWAASSPQPDPGPSSDFPARPPCAVPCSCRSRRDRPGPENSPSLMSRLRPRTALMPAGIDLVPRCRTRIACHESPLHRPRRQPLTIRRWNDRPAAPPGAVATTAAARIWPHGT